MCKLTKKIFSLGLCVALVALLVPSFMGASIVQASEKNDSNLNNVFKATLQNEENYTPYIGEKPSLDPLMNVTENSRTITDASNNKGKWYDLGTDLSAVEESILETPMTQEDTFQLDHYYMLSTDLFMPMPENTDIVYFNDIECKYQYFPTELETGYHYSFYNKTDTIRYGFIYKIFEPLKTSYDASYDFDFAKEYPVIDKKPYTYTPAITVKKDGVVVSKTGYWADLGTNLASPTKKKMEEGDVFLKDHYYQLCSDDFAVEEADPKVSFEGIECENMTGKYEEGFGWQRSSGTACIFANFPKTAGYTAAYRLYNKYSGEHLYTTDKKEADYLPTIGWSYEGISWYSPEYSDTPVYRLYNASNGEHLYTKDVQEKKNLINKGWKEEGITFYDAGELFSSPIYRLYNPFEMNTTNHLYTTDNAEVTKLVPLGWRDEGVAFNGYLL
ncbi:MAG: hypothetical protein HUJ63_06800 [Enterococcus sp.]|nr:hypothetical protein [Enterococcus sp.]